MADITFDLNGSPYVCNAEPSTPLLYILRNDLQLKGAKFGCGLGLCGACTVHIDGRAALSCDTPVWSVEGKQVTTIEDASHHGAIQALQEAFIAEQAAQCGYCTGGMIMAASALLDHTAMPSEQEIAEALSRNLCRCGSHVRIVRAIRRAAQALQS